MQSGVQLEQIPMQRATLGTILQMLLNGRRGHGIGLAIDVGLHLQGFSARHAVFL
jgi:hypothetical protein